MQPQRPKHERVKVNYQRNQQVRGVNHISQTNSEWNDDFGRTNELGELYWFLRCWFTVVCSHCITTGARKQYQKRVVAKTKYFRSKAVEQSRFDCGERKTWQWALEVEKCGRVKQNLW
jgi:hypothetical protein